MKVPPVAAELFHADERRDGRTDMTKLIVAFLSLADAPINEVLYISKPGAGVFQPN
jgi:hypothetical protein